MSQKLCYLPLLIFIALISKAQSQGCSDPCVVIQNCPSVIQLYRDVQAGLADVSEVRRLLCGYDNRNNPKFCCKETSKPVRTANLPSPSMCGIRISGNRVFGGDDASLFAWPWAALLRGTNAEGFKSFICGGVLISDRYVMTAAHCVVVEDIQVETVRLGEHTISTNPDKTNEGVYANAFQDIGVEEIIIHDQYGKPRSCRHCNDIALIRLNQAAEISISVSPICLPTNFEENLGFAPKDLFIDNDIDAWVVGWGNTEQTSVSKSDILQEAQVPIDPAASICSLDIGPFPDRNMVLCAGGNQIDTCKGDSGGPMMRANKAQTQFYVIGIVSKGPLICGAKDLGGLYTNVNHYIPWILSKLNQ